MIGVFLNVNVDNSQLEITVLDVGTGDAIHIKTKEEDYLIDNGGNLQRSELYNYTVDNNIYYDGVIVSNDRTNNLEDLSKEGRILQFIVPNNYIAKGHEQNMIYYEYYDKIEISEYVYLRPISTDGKYFSFAVEFYNEDVCLLLQNDATEITGVSAPVVKLAKGGADSSADQELIDEVDFKTAIISVRVDNNQGLPSKEVTDLLAANDINTIKTSESGAVIIEFFTDESFEIKTMK